tara:strand:+ start:636 stop:899 length:264 start_codon:yes stop_codon:yes gene_type:complete
MAKNKASLDQLNGLHGLVALSLSENLDDPRVLSQAIKFLKDNDITADFIESETMMSLSASIQKIAQDIEADDGMSVEQMIATSSVPH